MGYSSQESLIPTDSYLIKIEKIVKCLLNR